MPKETIETIVKAGKATAGPPLGPRLGPLGVNIGQIVADINQKTAAMAGMDVPIKLVVDTDTKTWEISVGTPPLAALIKKELGLEKGSGKPNTEKIADMPIDLAIRLVRAKFGESTVANVKSVLGTCVSMGITIEGKDPRDVQKEIDAGQYIGRITGKEALKEISREEIEAKKRELAAAIEAKRAAEAKLAEEAAAKEAAEKLEAEKEKPAEKKPTEEKLAAAAKKPVVEAKKPEEEKSKKERKA